MAAGRLRDAITRNQVSDLTEGGFPRYVWHREGDTMYEARLVNSSLGQYKGYPLHPDEWPNGFPE
jgi:hypothetical protein